MMERIVKIPYDDPLENVFPFTEHPFSVAYLKQFPDID